MSTNGRDLKKSRGAFGRSAEEALAQWLAKRGAKILDRNWRALGAELDLVAQEGEIVCFVEVRARVGRELGDPAETVQGPKQRQILRAALAYLAAHPELGERAARFDVAGLCWRDGAFEINYLPAAFEAEDY